MVDASREDRIPRTRVDGDRRPAISSRSLADFGDAILANRFERRPPLD
jgi:hypothetical protein